MSPWRALCGQTPASPLTCGHARYDTVSYSDIAREALLSLYTSAPANACARNTERCETETIALGLGRRRCHASICRDIRNDPATSPSQEAPPVVTESQWLQYVQVFANAFYPHGYPNVEAPMDIDKYTGSFTATPTPAGHAPAPAVSVSFNVRHGQRHVTLSAPPPADAGCTRGTSMGSTPRT